MRDLAAVIDNGPRQDGVLRYHKPVVGLAGGIGAGKSSVARIMGELGVGVIESDQLGRLEINSPEVKEMISRCRERNLRITRPPDDVKLELAVWLTKQTMSYVHSRDHRIAI